MTQTLEFEQLADRIANAIRDDGWCVIDAALPVHLVTDLATTCESADAFAPAGTGRQQGYQRDASVRSDAIRWLDTSNKSDAGYLATMESLKTALNSRLYLGLFDYESHYARYAPGAFYRRHLDAFPGTKNRVLSTVFYLNRGWREEEGGELLLYAPKGTEPFEAVTPQFNRMVVFQSERFPHEVKPATRVRHSIAGWFRIRS